MYLDTSCLSQCVHFLASFFNLDNNFFTETIN